MAQTRAGASPSAGDGKKKERESGLEIHLKRQAILVITQLPEDAEQAMRVLKFAEAIIQDFLRPSADEPDNDPFRAGPSLRIVS